MVKSEATPRPTPRRRGDTEETRRRVLDAAIATVIDEGYYRASSNAIARRAGVTWGVIQHLFGSREQLMLDVVNDIGERLEKHIASATVVGSTLDERLHSVLDVLAWHYEQDSYLVQVQILLDLSTSAKVSPRRRRAIRQRSGEEFDTLAQPLLEQALGPVAAEHDLVIYVFMTMRGYLSSFAVTRLIAEFPDNTIRRMIADNSDETTTRNLLVHGIAATIREEAKRRGHRIR